MIHSSPCVAGGRVFVGDMDGLFHAVDAGNGKRCWAFRAEGEIISSANHAGDRIVFGCYDGFVYCLTVDEGKLLWKSKTEGRVHGTAGIVDDKVLVAGCDSRFHIFNLENGASPAGLDIGSFSGASVAIRGPLAFVGTFNDQVLAVDWTGHRIVWSYSPGEQQSPFLSSAAVTDDLVVIGGRDKLIHALNRETGKVRWTFTTKGKVDSSPVIASHRVFVGSTDGTLYALDIKTGKEVWRFDAGSSFLASPAIGQGCLVIGAEDGIVYCFGSNGNGRR